MSYNTNFDDYKQQYNSSPKATHKFKGKWQSGVPQYNWAEISREYIQGIEEKDPLTNEKVRIFPTLEDIANKYGVNQIYLRRLAAQDKWSIQRSLFLRKLKEHANEIDLDDLLGISSRFDADYITALEHINTIVKSSLEPYAKEALEPGSIDTTELKPLTSTDMRNMVQTLKESHGLLRNIVRSDRETIKHTIELPPSETLDTIEKRKRIKTLTNQLMEAEQLREELARKKQELAQAKEQQSSNDKEDKDTTHEVTNKTDEYKTDE